LKIDNIRKVGEGVFENVGMDKLGLIIDAQIFESGNVLLQIYKEGTFLAQLNGEKGSRLKMLSEALPLGVDIQKYL
jgi:hypothetical protein